MNITIRQLEIFIAVSKAESYTQAAKVIHLTQPAVSMQIKQLEHQLGIPLFEQLGKKIYLTESGKEIHQHARNILEQLNEMETFIDNTKGLNQGKLRISVATTANYFAPALLSTFYKRFPGVTVTLDITNRQTLIQQLDENEVDLVIMGQPPKNMALDATPFMDNPLVIIAPPNHPLNGKKKIPLARLEEEVFLVRETGSGTRIAMEKFFKNHKLQLTTGMEISSSEAIKQSVSAGMGLGIIQVDAIQTELTLKQLVVLDVEHLPIQRHWYIVHRKGKRLSMLANAFKQFIIDESKILLGRDK
ncbi:MAG: LysR family transcriptional regulator [Chromatiales bacterium]|nr:LysR family transcriptional regulator [Chromatiales bacterium]